MGLISFVDDILGTDLSGDKAGKYYEQGYQAQQAATQQALAKMEEYGGRAVEIFKDYMNRGMAAEDAMRQSAIDAMNAGDQQAIEAYNREYQAGMDARRPYEDAAKSAMGAMPYLQSAMGLPSDQTFDMQASPMYQWQKEQGDKELTAQLNAMGISGDNTAAYIRGENISRLGAQETQRQMGDLQNLVGMGMQHGASLGQPQFQAARDLGGMAGQSGANIANILNQGAINRGNTFSNMAGTLGGYQMGMGANQANALLAGGQSAMNMGISRAQQPNAMNQLLNTGISAWGGGMFNKQASQPADGFNGGAIGTANYMGTGLPFMTGMSGLSI